MKVLIVIANLGDYHVPRIGHLIHYAKTRGDFEIHALEIFVRSRFYSHPQSRRESFLESLPSQVASLQTPPGGRIHLRTAARLVREVAATNPDVIVTVGYEHFFSWLLLAYAKFKTKKIIFMCESKRDDSRRRRVKEWLKGKLVARFDGALVGGQRSMEYMCELGIPKKLIRKGYDAVDNDYFSSNSLRARGEDAQLRAQHGLPERYILCVSRLVPRKNIRTLLKAYAESREEGVQLVVIGYGPEKQSLDQFAASLNISSSVKFIESVANSAMPLYYALAETFVLLSLQDQWGLAVNEALACGLPVIVSERCGCVDEIVRDGDNGFIVDPTNVPQIANRLNRIIKDSGLRASMGANSREVISEYGLPLFASNFIDLCLAIQDTPLTAVKQ